MKVRFVTPQTVSDLLLYFEEIKFLHYFVPYKMDSKDLRAYVTSLVPYFTLVYLNELPIGCFTLYPVQGESKKSYEIHGIARPDLKQLIGRKPARVVLDTVYNRIFKQCFEVLGKNKLIAKVYPEAKGALFFVKRFGFKRVPNTDKGREIWKLDAATYFSGPNLCSPQEKG
jgi:hypothetical protein